MDTKRKHHIGSRRKFRRRLRTLLWFIAAILLGLILGYLLGVNTAAPAWSRFFDYFPHEWW